MKLSKALKKVKKIKQLERLIKRDQDLILKRYEILKKKMLKLERLERRK